MFLVCSYNRALLRAAVSQCTIDSAVSRTRTAKQVDDKNINYMSDKKNWPHHPGDKRFQEMFGCIACVNV